MIWATQLNTLLKTHFLSNLFFPFLSNENALLKKQVKTLQQNHLSNETGPDSDDDPIFKRNRDIRKSKCTVFEIPSITNLLNPQLQQELVYNI